MNRDMDLRSYFMEQAPKSGSNVEVWNRTVDTLLKNGVNTMRELSDLGDSTRLFDMFMNKNKVADEKGCYLAREVRNKYEKAAHKADLLASGEVLVDTYIRENAPATFSQLLTNRVISALMRMRVETMSALAALSVKDVAMLHNIGEKSLELALLMREKYISEQNDLKQEERA